MSHPLLTQLKEKVLTVAEYIETVNELLSPLRVEVEGEVSDLKVLPQWVFFDLKDTETGAVLRCGLHAGAYRRMGVNVEDGMCVRVKGYGKIAPKRGNFGFWVSAIVPVGEGALRRAYEILLQKLKREGMFARKRPLPKFISHIGVISSRNGVVLQDLRNNLKPLGIRIDFVHAGVEGADSAPEILRAIEYFFHAKEPPQVLVLIRGGGSLESLQGFNNEAVCRALFSAPMPVLVGIGHDVDAPIATMVADWSASTPTAVAHVINESWAPLTETLPQLSAKIRNHFLAMMRNTAHRAELSFRTVRYALVQLFHRFEEHKKKLQYGKQRVAENIAHVRERVDYVSNHIRTVLRARIVRTSENVNEYERLLGTLDPRHVLARGYALVHNKEGSLVRSVRDVAPGDDLDVQVSDGTLITRVVNNTPHHDKK